MLRPSSLNATRRVARAAHTTAVRAGHELDVASLTSCLAAANVIRSDAVRPRVEQFSLGQSNPTYLLTWENDGAAYVSGDAFSFRGGKNDPFRLVLRKQPPGKLLRGAHAVAERARHRRSAQTAGGTRIFFLCGEITASLALRVTPHTVQTPSAPNPLVGPGTDLDPKPKLFGSLIWI